MSESYRMDDGRPIALPHDVTRMPRVSTVFIPEVDANTFPIFAAHKAAADGRVQIDSVVVVSNTALDDGTNGLSLKVRNLSEAEDLSSAVKDSTSDNIAADTVYALTVDQNRVLQEDDVIALVAADVGTGGTLSRVIVRTVYQVLPPA